MNARRSCRPGLPSRAKPGAPAGDANRTAGQLASRAEHRADAAVGTRESIARRWTGIIGRCRGSPRGKHPMHLGRCSFAACEPAAAPDIAPGGTADLMRQDLMHHGNGHGEAFAAAAALHDGPDGNPEQRRQNPMHLFAGNTAAAHQPLPRRKHPMHREAHRATAWCRATPCPSRADQRGARQSQKGFNADAGRCTRSTQMGLGPPWSFTAEIAQPHLGSRADAVAHVPSACFACICLHLR